MDTEAKLKKMEALYSNERTLLSYIRTAASVLVLAVALLRFFESDSILFLGWVTVAIGAFILLLGIIRYFQERKRIHAQNA